MFKTAPLPLKTKEMKTYKGQIDETLTEVDLTDFFKDNPKYAPKSKDVKKANKKSNQNESINRI